MCGGCGILACHMVSTGERAGENAIMLLAPACPFRYMGTTMGEDDDVLLCLAADIAGDI